MLSFLAQAFIFLMTTLINLYFFMTLLRALLQYLSIDRRNPILPVILKTTDPFWIPIQKMTTKYFKIDPTPLIILMALKCLEFLLICLVSKGIVPSLMSLIIWPIGGSLNQIINMLFLAVIIVVLLSWLGPRLHNPVTDLLLQITEPLMMPFRRRIPLGHGIDFSPLFVLVALKLIDILLAHPIMQLGERLSYQ
jgi:YggT family protein